jgi:2-polyprenyl-6-hydroxyphenyl methylase / 3-demethylubiquinone-9 3-methyltransferase
LQQSKGLQYNPLTQRYWLDADTGVNYLFATKRPE